MEYLVRLEQGRDRHPSAAVLNALAAAFGLDATEREHLHRLAKCSSGSCGATAPDRPDVRPAVRAVLAQLEPGIAYVTNRLGDILAYTDGFELLARPSGLLDPPAPSLARFVFTDERARRVLPRWEPLANELAFHLSVGPPSPRAEELVAELTAAAGPDFTERVRSRRLPCHGRLAWRHPAAGDLLFDREVLELPASDAQQVVVLLPADDPTGTALDRLRRGGGLALVR